MCSHLEALLPSMEDGVSSRERIYEDPGRHVKVPTPEELYLEQEAAALTDADIEEPGPLGGLTNLRQKLVALGLSRRKAAVVMDRIVYGLSFKEIALERGFTDRRTANRAYMDALKIIKSRGGLPK